MYLTLKDAILDSLADGPRTVELLENYLLLSNMQYGKEDLMNTIIDLLNEAFIVIGYPKSTLNEFFGSIDTDSLNNYWLDLSDSGKKLQKNITLLD